MSFVSRRLAVRMWSALALAGVMGLAPAAKAQTPAGSTGQCKDGSYTSAASKSGACRGHQGIKAWFADAGTTSASRAATPTSVGTAPAAAAVPAAPAAAPAVSTAATGKSGGKQLSPEQRAANTPQAPGGGGGKVWVNTESKVYHCEGSTFYGKTKAGQYMTEADAKAAGAHPDHNKPCSK